MPDLSSLMQIAPITAAGMVGQDQSLDVLKQLLAQEMQKSDLAAATQKQQFEAQNNPLLLQHQQNLNNYQTQVEIPKGLQDVTEKQLKNAYTTATQPSAIDAGNSTNVNTVGANKEKDRERFLTFLAEQSPIIKGIPAPARMGVLMQNMKEAGFDPHDAAASSWLMSAGSGETLPQHIDDSIAHIGQTKAKTNSAYLAQTQDAATRAAAEVQSAGITAGGHVKAAQITADGRRDVQAAKTAAATDIMARIRSGQVGLEKGATMFETLAMTEDDPLKKAQYLGMAQKLGDANIKAKAAGGGQKPDLNSIGITPASDPSSGLGADQGVGSAGTANTPGKVVGTGSVSGNKYKIIKH